MYPMATLLVGGAGYIAYQNHQPFRHTYLAAVRCWRVASAFSVCCPYDLVHVLFMLYAGATMLGVIDYKLTFAWNYGNENQRSEAVSLCQTRSAKRVLKALLTNGGICDFYSPFQTRTNPSLPGIFIKLGQHMSSLIVLPREWTSTMRPLQDQCEPTAYEDVQRLFQDDMGVSIEELFDDFDPSPIGVASLAQVHIAKHKLSGKYVAVKVRGVLCYCLD